MTYSRLAKHATGALFILLVLFGCSENPITGVAPQNEGIPTDQMSFVQWQPEMEQLIRHSLAHGQHGYDSEWIEPDEGGTVGSHNKTYGNKVEIPEGAITEAAEFSVQVMCVDGNEQCGAGIEFLPSTNFEAPVYITLSFEYLDLEDEEIEDLAIYFSQDGNFWFPLGGFYIDDDDETISFYVDHFTVYAWEL
ncbi:MAG: hypothetical protein ACE5D7_00770 [Fidelibacterota bacterium]